MAHQLRHFGVYIDQAIAELHWVRRCEANTVDAIDISNTGD